MSGGSLVKTGTAVSSVGLKAPAFWSLSNGASAELPSTLQIGMGDGVRISSGAVLSCGKITSVATTSQLIIDGGTLSLTADHGGIADLGLLGITSKGATLNVPDGVSASVQPIVAVEGDGGSLVKRGNGTLLLSSGNTYTGRTVVETGIIGLDSPDMMDSVDLATGTGVLINPAKWDSASITKLLSKMSAAGCDFFGFFTTEGDLSVLDDPLSLGDFTVLIDGAGTVVLNGANSWTGPTIVQGGVLAAQRGVGLPAGSKMIMAGGSWAPMTAECAISIDGSDPLFELNAGDALGLVAYGVDTAITLNQGAEIQIGVNAHFGELRLNDGAANRTLTLSNDFLFDDGTIHPINVVSEETNALARFSGRLSSGAVSNGSHFEFVGRGAVKLDGEIKTDYNELHFYNGLSTLSNMSCFTIG